MTHCGNPQFLLLTITAKLFIYQKVKVKSAILTSTDGSHCLTDHCAQPQDSPWHKRQVRVIVKPALRWGG